MLRDQASGNHVRLFHRLQLTARLVLAQAMSSGRRSGDTIAVSAAAVETTP